MNYLLLHTGAWSPAELAGVRIERASGLELVPAGSVGVVPVGVVPVTDGVGLGGAVV